MFRSFPFSLSSLSRIRPLGLCTSTSFVLPRVHPSIPHRSFSVGIGTPFVERTAAPSLNPSIWDKIFNRSSMPTVDLTESFPELPKIVSTPQIHANNYKLSTLDNGIRVITLPSASPVASIGIYVNAGSRYETDETSGMTHFMELMALKSTENRTDFRLVRETMKMGVAMNVSGGREHFSYTADCLHEFTAPTVATFADLIQNHSFHIEELMEEKEIYEEGEDERSKNMDTKILEAIHEAAYGDSGLGRALYPSLRTLPHITKETLTDYLHTFMVPRRMVFSAVGVDHEKFRRLIEETFVSLPDGKEIPHLPKYKGYVGGDSRVHLKDTEGPVHVALAWEAPSWHDKDFVPLCVLQSMMGGGGSFSAGGPGKGMYSRLYSNLLSRYDWVHHTVAFVATYTDTGLFGFYGITDPKNGSEMTDALVKEAVRMAGPVDSVELLRAKNSLKGGLLMQLESRAARLEDVGRQIMIYGKINSTSDVCALIDKVTAEDIQRVAKRLLATPVSVTAHGDCHYIPRYDQIQKHLR